MKTIFRTTLLHTLAMLPLAAFCLYGQADANETTKSAGKYEGASLCDAGDEVYNSCTTRTGRNLSICGTKEPAPNIIYFVYGTPEKILVSSPKTGKFPVGYTEIDESYGMQSGGYIYSFTENRKQYLAYYFYDWSENIDLSKGHIFMKGVGLFTRNDTDHKIINHDFCIKDVEYKEENNRRSRKSDYDFKEEKDSSHKARTKGTDNDNLPDEIYLNLYNPEE